MLDGKDQNEITNIRQEQSFVRDFLYTSGDTLLGQLIDMELKKLDELLSSQLDYEGDNININVFYRRFAYNLIYDEINMGTQNFVIACFENLLRRYPTEQELESGINMVDGQNAQLLLKGGNSKVDFLNILVNSTDFYAGRIIDAYESMLLRKPSSNELTELLLPFVESGNYENVLSEILKKDEYAGF